MNIGMIRGGMLFLLLFGGASDYVGHRLFQCLYRSVYVCMSVLRLSCFWIVGVKLIEGAKHRENIKNTSK